VTWRQLGRMLRDRRTGRPVPEPADGAEAG
jgi:hypothetical protein